MSEQEAPSQSCDLSRRGFLKFGLIASGVAAMPSLIRPAFAGGFGAYRVAFRNAHTAESFTGVYRVGDRYIPEALGSINQILRDYRTGDVHDIDPRLIDLVYWLHHESESSAPFEVISGYRSPQTNSMLRHTSSGVAKKSMHVVGKAVDLRLENYSTAQLRRIAVNLKAGGVGFYPKSNFLHIDTGKIRTW